MLFHNCKLEDFHFERNIHKKKCQISNHCHEHFPFMWKVFRAVIWHFFWRLETHKNANFDIPISKQNLNRYFFMIIKDTVLNLLFLHSRNVKNLSSYRRASNTCYTHPYPLLLTPIADPADHAIINILLFLAYVHA